MEEFREYQIRVYGTRGELLYVSPTVRVTEQDAKKKAAELLAAHGGKHFTVEHQVQG